MEQRKDYVGRVSMLKTERLSWESLYTDLGDYLIPRQVRLSLDDTNKGARKDSKIINSFGAKALSINRAGMHAGITSPARPWFRLTTADSMLMKQPGVEAWLYEVEQRMRLILSRSNAYKGLSTMYGAMASVGTGVLWVEEDSDSVLRTYNIPCGTYWLAADDRGVINTIYRELRMTAIQVWTRFGEANCSETVKDAYREGRFYEPVDVCHLVEPRTERKPGAVDGRNKPFRSLWWEKNSDNPEFLKIWGYDEFPALVARWDTVGNDVYGWGPGPDALGDIRALQALERRKGQLVDKMTNPPMKAPTSLLNKRASLLPGDVTFVDGNSAGATFEPAQKVAGSDIAVMNELIAEHERRIGEIFLTNLWLMMTNSDRREITAREIDERHEEKMLQIGPTLERLHDEVLNPFIDRVFAIMMRAGLLPPIPAALSGASLRVEYTSIMAQAQKLLSTTSVDRLAAFVGNIATLRPDVLDTLDWDDMVDTYADMLGTKPSLVKAAKEVFQIRKQRAQQQMQMQQLQQQVEAAKGAQSLARADTSGDNALTRMLAAHGGDQAVAQAGGRP